MLKRSRKESGCPVDMTPMIDVVFQLIIFFIVTIKLEERADPDIYLEDGKHGPVLEQQMPGTMTVEVNRRGAIAIGVAQMDRDMFRSIVRERVRRVGTFPVFIRADARAHHVHVRAVMDACAEFGIGQVSFAAVKERKVKK